MSSRILRKSFPIVRIVSVRGERRYEVDGIRQGTGNRGREFYRSQEKAIARANEIATEANEHGKNVVLTLQLRAMVFRCEEKLAKHGKTIDDATRFYVDHLEAVAERTKGATIEELIERWLESKTNSTDRSYRKDTIG